MQKAILQILPAMGTGGVELACLSVLPAIKQAGYLPLVVAQDGDSAGKIAQFGGKHIVFPAAKKNAFSFYSRIQKLRHIIQNNNVALVHARSRIPAWLGFYASQKTNAHFITSMHGAHSIGSSLKRYYNSSMVRGEKILAVSQFIRSHILEHYSDYTDAEKILVTYEGIDLQKFDKQRASKTALDNLRTKLGLQAKRQLLLMVGRATALKGHDLVLQAFAKLQHENPNLDLLFITPDISKATNWHEEAAQLGFEDRLFIRSIDNEALPLIYALADICVVGSKVPEAFGRVIAEAQIMGGLVVVPNSGACPELVSDGKNGFLYHSCNAAHLADIIKKAYELSPQEKNTIKLQAMQSAKAFSIEAHSKLVLQAYDEVLNV